MRFRILTLHQHLQFPKFVPGMVHFRDKWRLKFGLSPNTTFLGTFCHVAAMRTFHAGSHNRCFAIRNSIAEEPARFQNPTGFPLVLPETPPVPKPMIF